MYFIAGWSAFWSLIFCIFVVDTLYPPAPPWLWVCVKIFTFTFCDTCWHGVVIHLQRRITFFFAFLFTRVKAQSPHKSTDYRTILVGLWTLSKSKLFTTASNICSYEPIPPGVTTRSVFLEVLVIVAFISGVNVCCMHPTLTCPVLFGAPHYSNQSLINQFSFNP
jgi:hypothetical protein